jgi:glycosyltransferase involved in cell wall biosynthesis
MCRVLIVCEYPTLLGGERSMLAALPTIVANGFEVAVAAPGQGPLANELRNRGIRHYEWQTHSERQRFSLEQLRADLARVIVSSKPDVVHANSLSASRISGPVVRELGIPSIGHLRDIIRLSTQVVSDLNLHRLLIAVSNATRNFHSEQGIDRAKCDVVYNGVDLDEFRPRAPTKYLHSELRLPHGARLIAVIGQLGLRKGTDVALAAAKEIAGTNPDAHWLIVGERTSNKAESKTFETSLMTVAEQPPLSGRVHFLRVRTDVARILSECELLVHAARQEPLGRLLLEAAACGIPVIATDVGGTREIFPDESDSAVLVPPGSPEAIEEAARFLLANEPRRKQLGENARHRAEVAFDIRTAAANLIARYRSVLAH